MPTAALYARVSNEEARERQTIQNQREFAAKYADLHHLGGLLEFSDDGVTGAIPLHQRPAGARLLAAAQSGLVSTVYLYRLDRIGRSARHILNAIADLEEVGARVVSMTEPFDMRDASGKFLVGILASVAELERNTIAERTSGGIRRAAREGRWVGGTKPFGYQVTVTPTGQYLEPDEDPLPGHPLSPAAVIRHMYERIGTWGWSSNQTYLELVKMGVPPVTAPGSRKNRLGQPVVGIWRKEDPARLVRSPTYKGVLIYGKGSERGEVSRTCPSLVSEELWTRANANLDSRGMHLRQEQKGYFLTGLGFCGLCGYVLSGIARYDYKGDPYRTYRCSGRNQNRVACPASVLPMDESDRRVWREVVRVLDDPAATFRAAEADIAAPSLEPDPRSTLLLQLKQLAQGRDEIVNLVRRGRLSGAAVERHLDEIDREEAERQRELAALPVGASLSNWRQDAESLLAEARELLALDADPPTRREILRLLARRVVAERTVGEKGVRWQIDWKWTPQSSAR